jgi:uncharacterized membrane protein YbaN (DUF454 family)
MTLGRLLPIDPQPCLIQNHCRKRDIRVRRALYKPLGFLFLGFAALGVVLPLLPGTPFLLLAAWFFARSSEKWHRRLLANELTGPMIRNWEENRCISRRTRRVAILMMLIVGGTSVLFAVQQPWLKALGVVLLTIGSTVVLRIPSCESCAENRPKSKNGLESIYAAPRDKAPGD